MTSKNDILYHLTDKEHLTEILENGLIPQIGDTSQSVGDNRNAIFLCDEKSIRYWKILLKKSVLLKISNVSPNECGLTLYSDYNEYTYDKPIPPQSISLVSTNVSGSRKHMHNLRLSYLISISCFTLDCARYYNDEGYKTKDELIQCAKNLLLVLKRLKYTSKDMSEYEDYLKKYGEEGEYTFCDTYNDTTIKLWQQLIKYNKDDNLRPYLKKLYKFIETTFPFAKTLNTGGWEAHMSNTCDTHIHFSGDEAALNDLFSRIKYGWLGDIAAEFKIDDSDCPYDKGFMRGDIIDIDDNTHDIFQEDAWCPRTEIWQAIINKHYKDKISFVYKSEEPGSSIYINTDTAGLYFTEKFVCDYCVDSEDDTVYFCDEKSLLDWANDKFNASTSSVNELRQYMDDYVNDMDDEYCTIGEYESL